MLRPGLNLLHDTDCLDELPRISNVPAHGNTDRGWITSTRRQKSIRCACVSEMGTGWAQQISYLSSHEVSRRLMQTKRRYLQVTAEKVLCGMNALVEASVNLVYNSNVQIYPSLCTTHRRTSSPSSPTPSEPSCVYSASHCR